MDVPCTRVGSNVGRISSVCVCVWGGTTFRAVDDGKKGTSKDEFKGAE